MFKTIVFWVVGILFIAHFAVLALHHLPDNPIKHQYKFQIEGYINPFFAQQWNLFAPNPVSSNMSVHYKYAAYSDGELVKKSNWLDANEPLIQLRRDHNFSTGQRLLKYLSSSCIDIMNTRSKLLEQVNKIDTIAGDSAKVIQYVDRLYETSHGHKSLIEYSKYIAKLHFRQRLYSYDSLVGEYRILDEEFPRFSKRHVDYFDKDNYVYSEFLSRKFRIK